MFFSIVYVEPCLWIKTKSEPTRFCLGRQYSPGVMFFFFFILFHDINSDGWKKFISVNVTILGRPVNILEGSLDPPLYLVTVFCFIFLKLDYSEEDLYLFLAEVKIMYYALHGCVLSRV